MDYCKSTPFAINHAVVTIRFGHFWRTRELPGDGDGNGDIPTRGLVAIRSSPLPGHLAMGQGTRIWLPCSIHSVGSDSQKAPYIEGQHLNPS